MALDQPQQGREDLLVGEVAGGAEEHDRVGNSGVATVSVADGVFTDAAGNPGTGGSDSVSIDRLNASVAVNIVDPSLNDGDSSSQVTFTFSEAPVGFVEADIQVSAGLALVAGSLAQVAGNPLLWTATVVRPTALAGWRRYRWRMGSFTDAAGNPGTGGSDSVSIDRLNASVAVNIVDPSLNDADSSSQVTFTFSEAPVGFVEADIQVSAGLTLVAGSLAQVAGNPLLWTATVAAADGFSGVATVSVADGVFTDAAGNPGTGGSDSVSIDRLNASVAVNIVDPSLNDADSSSQVTFTFSEAPVGFVEADIQVSAGLALVAGSLAQVAGNPLLWTATVAAADGFSGVATVSVADGVFTDAAGNPGTGGSDSVSIDRLNASVAVNIVDPSLNDADSSSQVTFTFSEAPVGFVEADIQVSAGLALVAGSLAQVAGNPLLWTATVAAADGFSGVATVSVADGVFTDAAGNPGTGGSDSVTIDRLNASVAVNIVDPSLNDADSSSQVTFTFSEAPVGFVEADIQVSAGLALVAGSLAQVAGNPLLWTATVAAADGFSGVATVSVADGVFTDAAGNPGTGGSDSVTIDRLNASVAVNIVDPSLNDADSSSQVTFTFSEAPVGFVEADIQVSAGLALVAGSLAQVAGNPLLWTATVAAADGFSGVATVSVADGVFTDAAGNPGTGGSDSVSIDRLNASVAVNIVDPSLNDADSSSQVTFTFSEAPVGFVEADIQVSAGLALVAGSLAQVAGNPLLWTATVAAADGFSGVATVSVADGVFTDAAGNPGTGGSDSVSIDRLNASVAVNIVDPSLNDADSSSQVTFTFSEAPVGFVEADIQVSAGLALVAGSLAQVAGNPLLWTATVAAADGFSGVATVSVADGVFTDAAGNPGTGGSDSVSIDRLNASVAVNIVDPSLNDADSSSQVTFTFSEAPVGFVEADIQVSAGLALVAGSLAQVAGNPLLWTATVAAADGFSGVATVSVADGVFTDAAGNPGTGGSDSVSIDRLNASVAVNIVDPSLNDADSSSQVTFTFSEAPVGFVEADIQVSAGLTLVAGSLAQVAGNPLLWTATVAAADGFSGVATVSVADGVFTDAAGNPGTGGSDSVSIDRLNASVAVNIVDPSLNDADSSSQVTFTFSEAPVGFVEADIQVSAGLTLVAGSLAQVAGNPLLWTATVAAADGFSGVATVSVADGVFTDAAGNPGTGGSDSVTIDRLNASVAVNIVDPSLNDADSSSQVTFTFSEAPVGFVEADIQVSAGLTLVAGSLAQVAGNPLLWTATVAAADGFSGVATVSVADGVFTDAAGNPGTGGSDSVSIDRLNASVAVNIVDGSLNSIDSSSLVTFVFSELPFGFNNADLTIIGGTLSTVTQHLVLDPSGKTYTATFTAADGFSGVGSVSVTAGGYTDAAGNAGGSGTDTVNIDTLADPNDFDSLGKPTDDIVGNPDQHQPQTIYGGAGKDTVLGEQVSIPCMVDLATTIFWATMVEIHSMADRGTTQLTGAMASISLSAGVVPTF